MKRVLVIGANSYIGKKFNEHIQLFANEAIEIDLVSASNGSWEKVDFSSYNSILHLSAIVHMKEKETMIELYKSINYLLPIEIANKAKDNGVKQFVFMSTLAVYGDINGCITKETMPNPTTLYGKTKLAAENEIIKLEDSEFKVAIIRSPLVYGEGCRGNYERLVKFAKIALVFPDYHNRRSHIHVNRLCNVIIDIILNKKYGYFFPQDESYADTCEIIVNIRKEMGKKTYLTSLFNKLIDIFKKKFTIFRKIFGDLYYTTIS